MLSARELIDSALRLCSTLALASAIIRSRSRSARRCEWWPTRIGCPSGIIDPIRSSAARAAAAFCSRLADQSRRRSAFASLRSR